MQIRKAIIIEATFLNERAYDIFDEQLAMLIEATCEKGSGATIVIETKDV
jgi:hypothetical protein